MRNLILALILASGFSIAAPAQTPIDIQPVKELKPTGVLATCTYAPVTQEAPFLSRVSDKERINDPLFHGKYTIHSKVGKEIAWFGIVRGIAPPAQPGGEVSLLIQHHFFDGETDCHIMLVAKSGDGDFIARLKADSGTIPALSLVRIYGKVSAEQNGVPQVQVDYLRIWPWLTFTFTDLSGDDHSNPRWLRASEVKPGSDIYNPYPNRNWYLKVLGDPADFGLNLKPE